MFLFLGFIKCVICRLLPLMIAASVGLSVMQIHSASLYKNGWTDQGRVWEEHFVGPNQHCERRGSWFSHSKGSGRWGKISPIMDPSYLWKGWRQTQNFVCISTAGAIAKNVSKRVGTGVAALLVELMVRYDKPLHEEHSSMCNVCGAFDAVFAKLLWPFVICHILLTISLLIQFCWNLNAIFFTITMHISYKYVWMACMMALPVVLPLYWQIL